MLEFHPQRIGHACYFEDEHWRKLKSSKIPVRLLHAPSINLSKVFDQMY
jgi:adenosine deaminase